MKKIIIFLTSFALISSFLGCSEKKSRTIKIEKVNGLTYEFVNDIIDKYPEESVRTMNFIT